MDSILEEIKKRAGIAGQQIQQLDPRQKALQLLQQAGSAPVDFIKKGYNTFQRGLGGYLESDQQLTPQSDAERVGRGIGQLDTQLTMQGQSLGPLGMGTPLMVGGMALKTPKIAGKIAAQNAPEIAKGAEAIADMGKAFISKLKGAEPLAEEARKVDPRKVTIPIKRFTGEKPDIQMGNNVTSPSSLEFLIKKIKAGERPTVQISDNPKSYGSPYIISDGNHTYQAYKKVGITDIPIDDSTYKRAFSSPTPPTGGVTPLAEEARKYKSMSDYQPTTGDNAIDSKVKQIVEMSPDEYLQRAFQATDGRLGGSYDSWLASNAQDAMTVRKYAEAMKRGDKFPLAYIDEAMGSQDGRNRALAVKLAGREKMPVGIVPAMTSAEKIAWLHGRIKEVPEKSYLGNKYRRDLESLTPPTGGVKKKLPIYIP